MGLLDTSKDGGSQAPYWQLFSSRIIKYHCYLDQTQIQILKPDLSSEFYHCTPNCCVTSLLCHQYLKHNREQICLPSTHSTPHAFAGPWSWSPLHIPIWVMSLSSYHQGFSQTPKNHPKPLLPPPSPTSSLRHQGLLRPHSKYVQNPNATTFSEPRP